jgi:hypothetical protein
MKFSGSPEEFIPSATSLDAPGPFGLQLTRF